MNFLWVRGLFLRSVFRIGGTAVGVGLAVALIASLGLFLEQSAISMTERAASAVPVDWQVEVVPSADPHPVESAIRKATTVSALHEAFYADTAGFQAQTGRTTQTTGPGKAIAFDKGYLSAFPKEVRLLTGSLDGPMLFQQTAANLHARPGDTVTINREGVGPVQVTITGVVDLPDADALFQAVGLPPSAAPQAPPDNVVLLPAEMWHRLFDPQRSARPDTVRIQYHVRLDRSTLPSNPTRAFTYVSNAARNLEARVAGRALVGNNLAARLDAVRGDALYAKVLFLFLGLPGIVLAAALTVAVTHSNSTQRRMEQALLRVRGASSRQIVQLAATEALAIAVIGVVLGGGTTTVLGLAGVFGAAVRFTQTLSFVYAAAAGLVLAFASVLLPAWLGARTSSNVFARSSIVRIGGFAWLRYYPDVILLAASGLFFWQIASTGYQIVLAPEGVAATSVDYKAFIAPALFWAGTILLALRLSNAALSRRAGVISALVRLFSGSMTPAVSPTLAHQSRRIALGAMMLSLAVSFAVSTAIFNTTYNAQARVDAELTNGSDVTVFGTSAHPAGQQINGLAALPNAAAVEPMQHRFAYVGPDLQDMYGIDPRAIGHATSLSNAYFSGGTAKQILARLASTPNGVLVSEETVKDFQLKLGDTINLRMIDARDNQYHPVTFKFVGVVREFPTAPKDSFLVANAAYVAQQTHSSTTEFVLMKAKGDPALLATEASDLLAGHPGLAIKDIESVTHIIGSSLTAVDLRGLTRIELSFAVAMAAVASGLLLILGFLERKRTFAILKALGAKPSQMAAFVWSEGIFVLATGAAIGSAAGMLIAWMLVKLLTGVFDPPPESLAYPALYLGVLFGAVVICTVVALWLAVRVAARRSTEVLRTTVLA